MNQESNAQITTGGMTEKERYFAMKIEAVEMKIEETYAELNRVIVEGGNPELKESLRNQLVDLREEKKDLEKEKKQWELKPLEMKIEAVNKKIEETYAELNRVIVEGGNPELKESLKNQLVDLKNQLVDLKEEKKLWLKFFEDTTKSLLIDTKKGSASKQTHYKEKSAPNSLRNFFDAIANRMQTQYNFKTVYRNATFGDVLKAKKNGKWECYNPAMVPLPNVFTPEEWAFLEEENKKTNDRIHSPGLPRTSSGRSYILVDASNVSNGLSSMLKTIGVKAGIVETKDDLLVKDISYPSESSPSPEDSNNKHV